MKKYDTEYSHTGKTTCDVVDGLFNRRRACPLCSAVAIVPLTPRLLLQQKDGTTHVCHPELGGCGHGARLAVIIQPRSRVVR